MIQLNCFLRGPSLFVMFFHELGITNIYFTALLAFQWLSIQYNLRLD